MDATRGSSMPSSRGSNEFVSKILQVALGLFVTTSDLPAWKSNLDGPSLMSYNCDFNTPCRWTSRGGTVDQWRLATGQPDPFLWFTATGTMQLPVGSFSLIEIRDQKTDELTSDLIECFGPSTLSFTYWTIGGADLEICLTDESEKRFNCTGLLHARTMPGRVSLNIPTVQRPFHVSIIAASASGIIALDDIKYESSECKAPPPGLTNATTKPDLILPWTEAMPPTTSLAPTTQTLPTFPTFPTFPTIFPTQSTVKPTTVSSSAEAPFDLLIVGNRTEPLFDRRRGRIVSNVSKLICDFSQEFPCLWGAESGRWALISKGAIPSMEGSVQALPSFPAAVVLQGKAVLTSDPLECQTGPAKLLFRYWSNGVVRFQVCAFGFGLRRDLIDCATVDYDNKHVNATPIVFDLNKSIDQPFTLNIIPEWEASSSNQYMIIDEIAYIGSCTPVEITTQSTTRQHSTSLAPFIHTTPARSIETSSQPMPVNSTPHPTWRQFVWTKAPLLPRQTTSTRPPHYKVFHKLPYVPRIVIPHRGSLVTHRGPAGGYVRHPYPRYRSTPTPKRMRVLSSRTTVDYCSLINCNFQEDACDYLNHGLTRVPWTLRSRGYGPPLADANDIHKASSHDQFVSALLSPGDFAILESAHFKATPTPNVLLFQHFRPSSLVTVRLCLDTHYSPPYLTSADFKRCPAIIKTASTEPSSIRKWTTVHVQLPPGTTKFFLVAHNLDRSVERVAVGIDNIRVAVCNAPSGIVRSLEDDMLIPVDDSREMVSGRAVISPQFARYTS